MIDEESSARSAAAHSDQPASVLPDAADDRARLAALAAMASRPELADGFVLKGGLALWYAYGSPRRSTDLDFDALADHDREVTEQKSRLLVHVCHELERALAQVAPAFGFGRMAVQRKRLSDEIPTVMTQLGFDTDPEATPPLERWVEMQITLCEVVCETTCVDVNGIKVRVPVLEDILAEKLKAMAQQVDRRKTRPMDVFDIWYFTRRADLEVDRRKVSDYFMRKTAALGPSVNRNGFDDDLLRAFSGNDYAMIVDALGDRCELPPFSKAFEAVVDLASSIG